MNLEQLYSSYKNDLLSFANHITNDRQLAEEIVDDVFISIWKKNPKVENYKAYLYRAVKLCCYSYLRSAGRKRVKYIEDIPASIECEYTVYDETPAFNILCKVCTLTPGVARDIYLHYIAGVPAPIIAQRTNRGRQSVQNNLYRGTQLLKQQK